MFKAANLIEMNIALLIKKCIILFLLFFISQQIFSQPGISSFYPIAGPVGTTVTITGSNFNLTPANNIVYFGAVRANVSAASLNSLTVTMPTGASYQPITVTVNGLVSASVFPFTLTYPGGGALTTTSYETRKSFSTGNNPQAISSGDLDSDGKPDIVTPNFNNNTISILKNTSGNGIVSFATKLDYATGGNPANSSIGDLDGDGKLDIAVLNSLSNTVSIYKNTSNSTISFAAKIDFPTGVTPFGIAVADFNGDGKQDIVVSNYGSNTVSVLKNNSTIGNISFDVKSDFIIGENSYTVTVGDLDSDSKADLISTNNRSNSISILRNTSSINTISFAAKIDFSTIAPATATIADFDGDGKQDIAVGSETVAFVSVFRNLSSIGNISLAPKIDYAIAGVTFGISAGDLNGDGKPDIVAGFSTSSTISLIENTGSPGALSFKQPVNYNSDLQPFYVIVQDVDGDGVNDFVSANAGPNSISVFRNKLNAYLVPTISSFTPTSTTSGINVTINGNNFTGVTAVSFGGVTASSFTVISSNTIQATVSNGASGDVSVTTGNGTGTLAGFIYYTIPAISSFTPQSGPVGATVVINGNNFSPVISNNIVYFGGVKANITSATSTTLTVTVPFGATYQPITVTNITTNLSAYSAYPFLVTFSSNGVIDANSFAAKVDVITAANPIDCFLGDLDNDGQLDLAIANSNSNFFSLFRNTSSTNNISFGSEKNYLSGWYPSKVVLADLNGDGKLEIVTSSVTPDSIYIYKNNSNPGNLSLNFEAKYPTGLDPVYIAIQDLNADGKPDIVIANYNSKTISIFKNNSANSNISFLNVADYSTGSLLPRSIAIGDIDGDGKPDLSVVCSNSTMDSLSVFRNLSANGNIAFDSKVDFVCARAPWNVAIGDLDGDGKLDIAICGFVFDKASVLRNISSVGAISFAPKIDFTTGRYPESIAIDDINGDGKPDIITGNYLDNTISILKNNSSAGLISFAPKADYATGTNPKYVAVGDIDKDGKPDICVANLNSNTVSVLRNQIASAPTISAVISYTGSTTRCSGDSIILNANTGTGLSYQWYRNSVIINGATSASYTANVTGNYSVVVSNGSGSATSNIVSVSINPVPTITSQGDTMLISSSAPNYQWYYNNNIMPGETFNSLRVKKVGFYRVETSSDKICWSASLDFPILMVNGRLADTLNMEIYPNPANNFFIVVVRLQQTTTVTAFVIISDVTGNVVLQTNKLIFFGNEIKIPITLNATGTFFVKVNINGDVKTLSVILQ